MLTGSQKMVRFSVSDMVVAGRFGPPRWSLCVTLGVRVVSLLLGLNQLDKGFSHDLAGRLLHVLEPDIVELLHLLFVADG